ncbi:MAG: DNA-binding transcriptional regulator [Selenomonas sp.]|nr:DNA-binding transcriptional regulator [Selenomonas sp.]
MKTYDSPILASVHDSMRKVYEHGGIDRKTMREFDELCLAPVQEFSSEDIRALRERENLSQPVFARYLNVSKNIVSDWERGVKKPGGPALRLLSLMKTHGVGIFATA